MGFLNWIKGNGQLSEKSIAGTHESARANARIKEPGTPFKKGDRVVVYEPFQDGRKAKRPPETPGIVDSVYHNGLLVSYERMGKPAGNAPTEDVRHATELDARKYVKEYAAIETKIERQQTTRIDAAMRGGRTRGGQSQADRDGSRRRTLSWER